MFSTRRLLAATIGLWLVVCGVLGKRHEAQVAHHSDGSGDVFHVTGMVGLHTGDGSDVHASGGAVDHDACEIAAASHHTGSAQVSRPAVSLVSTVHELPASAGIVVVTDRVVFRIAPKTSPPRLG